MHQHAYTGGVPTPEGNHHPLLCPFGMFPAKDGFITIAVENMANAIKHISVERGYDVTEYTLCCFGGAGGQHACLVADTLGMTRVQIGRAHV